MGTEESKMTSPTFDHFPRGSRFTPLLIKALKKRERHTPMHKFWVCFHYSPKPNVHLTKTTAVVTCARSRLLVFSVLVRMVTGLWISLASRKSTSCQQQSTKQVRLIIN